MLTHLKKTPRNCLSFFPSLLTGTRRTNLHPSDCDTGKELLQLSGFKRPWLSKYGFGGTKLILLCIDPFSIAHGHSFFGNLTKSREKCTLPSFPGVAKPQSLIQAVPHCHQAEERAFIHVLQTFSAFCPSFPTLNGFYIVGKWG